jgi:uncharacterized FlaG/YvyC family protein
MEIKPIQSSAAALPAGAPANASQNRELAGATRNLNQEGVAGPGREFTFAIDPKTKLAVVRLVDATSGKLIDQFPSDYILQMAKQFQELRSTKSQGVR